MNCAFIYTKVIDDCAFLLYQGEQLIVVSSWLGVKESCFCLAKLIENVPLPKLETDEKTSDERNDLTMIRNDQIDEIGGFFLEVLQFTKHNGVIEKSHSAFMRVCRRLLNSNDEQIRGKVSKWLDVWLDKVDSSAVEHWIRRSAGFPFYVQAILEV